MKYAMGAVDNIKSEHVTFLVPLVAGHVSSLVLGDEMECRQAGEKW